MGFFGRLFGLERRENPYDVHDLFRELTGGAQSRAGISINWKAALGVSTVLACGRVLSEDTGGLPVGVYQRQGNHRIPQFDSPLQALLDRPNDWQTGEEFREVLTLHAALTGNGLAYKHVVGGEVRELLPILPGWYTIEQQQDWSTRYRISFPDGPQLLLTGDQVLHVRGPVWDAVSGMDIVRIARDAIGLSIATERAHADLHRNGVQTSGLYSVDGNLDEPGFRRLSALIESKIGGDNKHKPLILDRAARFTPISMTGVDSQHLETRRYQIEEIARNFRVFPVMLGHTGDQSPTFASAEQFFLAHVKYSLLPWVRRWESAITRSLIPRGRLLYVRHNVAALERADIKTRYEAYQMAINAGWMRRSDPRELEDMEPVPGLDRPTLPVNIAVLDKNGLPIPGRPAAPVSTEGGGQRSRPPFDSRARTYLRDAFGRFASYGTMVEAVLAGQHPVGALARIGRISRRDRIALRKTGLQTKGIQVHVEDRVLKKAMRVKGSRRPATAEDLRAVPHIMQSGNAESYIDTKNGTLLRVREAPDDPALVVKYAIRPGAQEGGNRLVTVMRVASGSITGNQQFKKVG